MAEQTLAAVGATRELATQTLTAGKIPQRRWNLAEFGRAKRRTPGHVESRRGGDPQAIPPGKPVYKGMRVPERCFPCLTPSI